MFRIYTETSVLIKHSSTFVVLQTACIKPAIGYIQMYESQSHSPVMQIYGGRYRLP